MSEKARIRRGTPARSSSGTARRRPPTVTQQRRPVTVQRGKVMGPVRKLVRMPVPMATVKLWAGRAAWIVAAGAVVALALFLRLPQMAGVAMGEGVGAMGLSVRNIQIDGIQHMDRLTVASILGDQQTVAMPLLDLQAIRKQLLTQPWVEDARVSRRLPDTLLVDIVERKPVAIWQFHQKLNLIDKDGRVLAPVDINAMPDLPLLVGPDANTREAALAQLMEVAPQLKPMIAGASWVGGRRWDLRFQSGETLALPEGDGEAKAALAKFQRMDQAARLLGQGFVHFDMRVPDRLYVRVSKDPGSSVTNLTSKLDGAATAVPATKTPAPATPADT